jgi:hypothetical protein
MRRDVKLAITFFVIVLIVFAVASWIGYDRWSDVVQ